MDVFFVKSRDFRVAAGNYGRYMADFLNGSADLNVSIKVYMKIIACAENTESKGRFRSKN